MKKKRILTKDDILHVAKLAKLKLTEEEIEKYLGQLSAVVEYINKLNELDTKNIVPISHITGLTNVFKEDGLKNKRQLTQESALKNAKSTKNGYIKVKAIFSRE